MGEEVVEGTMVDGVWENGVEMKVVERSGREEYGVVVWLVTGLGWWRRL